MVDFYVYNFWKNHVKEIPKLGTGKNDFGAIKKVTQESLKWFFL